MWTLALTFWVSAATIAAGLGLLTWVLANNRPEDSPKLGSRGLARKQTLESGGVFAAAEPAIRFVAGWIAYLPLKDVRDSIDALTRQAGDWLGVTANEFLALATLAGLAFAPVGAWLAWMLGFDPYVAGLVAGLFGFVAPWLQAQSARDARFVHCNRTLPGAIDLASLCMGAGLDFPGSLKQIVEKSGRPEDPLMTELSRILQELELGRTRRQALENFAERVPSEAVRDFVSAVVQAEEKGSPLAETLRIQATMLRMRRSVNAEEAAAKAAVAMLGPLMLIFICILLLLLAPFIMTAGEL